MTKHGTWVVTTSGSLAVADVARTLTENGFVVQQVMETIGVITGQCAENRIDALRRLPGVSEIAPDFPIDIGPPDSPDVW